LGPGIKCRDDSGEWQARTPLQRFRLRAQHDFLDLIPTAGIS